MKSISAKKLKKLGGKMPFSSIQKRTKPKRGKAAVVRRRRTKREKLRIYGPPGYVEWIHTLPCVACRIEGFSECAHVGRSSGMGRKGSWRETVPLCRPRMQFAGCHWQSHTIGRESFEKLHGIDLDTEAETTHEAWLWRTREDTKTT